MPSPTLGGHETSMQKIVKTPLCGREKYVLQLCVVVERVWSQIATDSGLLEAPEGRRHAHRVVRVDGDGPGLERPRDAHRAARAAGPDRSGKTVDGVVGDSYRLVLVSEWNDRGDRAEDLLARDAVSVRHGRA